MIDNAKHFKELDEDEQFIFVSMEELFLLKNQRNYSGLVPCMMKLKDFLDQREKKKATDDDIEVAARIALHVQRGRRCLEDTVTAIQDTPRDLIAFAYELRKQDADDKYSWDFLNGQVTPAILVDIIMSNTWNNSTFTMEQQKKAPSKQI